jgi:ammonia channel protein AmtB
LIGAAFCWVFFPSINIDIPTTLFIYSNGGISTLYSISSAVATSVAFSLVLNGKLMFRDIITAPIAGGVVIGSAAIYIYNPLEALIFGFVAAILQVIFNKIEKKFGSHPPWSNGVFFLFGVQGFLGGIFSSVMRAVNKTSGTYSKSYSGLISKYVYDQGGQISAAFITLAISVLTGIFTYIFIRLINEELP